MYTFSAVYKSHLEQQQKNVNMKKPGHGLSKQNSIWNGKKRIYNTFTSPNTIFTETHTHSKKFQFNSKHQNQMQILLRITEIK